MLKVIIQKKKMFKSKVFFCKSWAEFDSGFLLDQMTIIPINQGAHVSTSSSLSTPTTLSILLHNLALPLVVSRLMAIINL